MVSEPTQHFQLTIEANEMTDEERAAAGVARTVDEIQLDLTGGQGDIE